MISVRTLFSEKIASAIATVIASAVIQNATFIFCKLTRRFL